MLPKNRFQSSRARKALLGSMPGDDLDQMVKAIFDSLVDEVPARVEKSLQPRLKEFRDDVASMVGRLADKHLESLPGRVTDAFQPHLKAFQDEVGALRDAQVKQLVEMRGHYDARLSEMGKSCETRIAELGKAYEKSLAAMAAAVKAMPVPTVNVAAAPPAKVEFNPQINVAPSDVNLTPQFNVPETAVSFNPQINPTPVSFNPQINVPEKSIQVNVKQAEVTIPENAIRVSVEHKSFLEMPERKTVTEREVVYDQTTGRPDKIKETKTEKSVLDKSRREK